MTADVDVAKLARELLLRCHKVNPKITGVTVYKRVDGATK